MSGELVGLVRKHGPANHAQWAVLTVIAEDLRGPMKSSILSDEEIAEGSRLSRTTVRRAMKGLVDDGWVGVRRGTNRGAASVYRLRLAAFPDEAVTPIVQRAVKGPNPDPSEILTDLERGSQWTPLGETVDEERGSPRTPFTEKGVHHGPRKGSTTDPPTVYVTTPSAGEAADATRDVATPEAAIANVREHLAALKTNGRASGAAQEEKDPMRSHHVDDDLADFIAQQTAGLRELHDRRYG